ncbi:MAG TPA: RsmE family RNA methyltransferase [Candidatus Acidoferrales bacterium]|nr:RsmE family RNA methyltransferase [Candidatus Acidoferrales bacterium]
MRRRFFVERFDGDSASLEGESAHHLGKVLRAATGQIYELSDGNSVRLARVVKLGREKIEFALLDTIPARARQVQSTLLLSIVKFDRFEWAIEKATELGVSAVVPLVAKRSESALVSAAAKRAVRWQKIVVESAQQARLLRPPLLRPVARAADGFKTAASEASDSPGPRIILSEREAAPPIRKVLGNIPVAAARGVVLAVGPEGGWTDEEFALSASSGFVEASLGPNILRTETAVAAALASINFVLE